MTNKSAANRALARELIISAYEEALKVWGPAGPKPADLASHILVKLEEAGLAFTKVRGAGITTVTKERNTLGDVLYVTRTANEFVGSHLQLADALEFARGYAPKNTIIER
jgi:hypothetical protein